MKEKHYSSERSIQLLILLLKAHNIKKIVASPGATNLSFVASLMYDGYFELYSSVDERSAAYIACGLAAESGEPVVLTCTGATASRNYLPGLTEAYYRKLPVLAVTSTQDIDRIGHHIAQVIDRRVCQHDVALLSEHIPVTDTPEREWSNTVRLNRALLELRHRGGGPVHVNLTTTYSRDYSVEVLPEARVIRRTCTGEAFPELPSGRIAVFIGAHRKFTPEETAALDAFCAAHDAVAFCDHTSGYRGHYRVQGALLTSQLNDVCLQTKTDLLIHIGEVSGAYMAMLPKTVWRVNPDGELRDTYRQLSHVFEMEERTFFEHYAAAGDAAAQRHAYLDSCLKALEGTRARIPETLPFSNAWMAWRTASRLPSGCVLHLGILNSLRCWNFFELPSDVWGYANTGGFGIDGGVSSLVGASLADPSRLYFGVVGDLAFFYDMNVVGNRHVGPNVRLLLVNNGKGTEFRNFNHPGAAFGDEADLYIAAAGHYGNKSRALIRHYAEDLGWEYLSATTKEEYLAALDRFLAPGVGERPVLLEAFTTNEDESDALHTMMTLTTSAAGMAKNAVKGILGQKGVDFIKKTIMK